ncbi:hypothetical protein [Kibdelosporangium phytohabitans]|uniref:Uncharacterized protein n=1 Tax=Kibdelosporangium phytohabitans TaxID=860235 RepID=A0A0N9HXJ9_9PSEU|nr:hypothetical protein [Kibdelosporangium phytohabitans]ALG07977.1 hypothetical protein AOZ06_14575 [Kibdelosporangium phytohabitans]MBE1471072.1 hypothetical protein [Kibdelosporangium phytohabitans]
MTSALVLRPGLLRWVATNLFPEISHVHRRYPVPLVGLRNKFVISAERADARAAPWERFLS